jgi:PAS domain S-box-containing protein
VASRGLPTLPSGPPSSDECFTAIFQSSVIAIGIAEIASGRLIDVNKGCAEFFGYSRGEMIGRTVRDLGLWADPADREQLAATLSRGGPPVQREAAFRRKSGEIRHALVSMEAITLARVAEPLDIVILVDMTERKRVEGALRESEERFRQIAENIRKVFWLTDPAKNEVLYVSPAYETIWQRDRAALLASPRAWLDAVHPEDRGRVEQAAVAQASGEYAEEYRIVRPDGSIRWISDRAFVVPGEDGEVSRIAGLAEDITDRKRVADELRESERRFSDMLANLNLVSLMLDRDARITYCNDYLLRLSGWTREDVIGRSWFDLFLPPGEGNMGEEFLSLLRDLPAARHHENEILTRAGGRRMIRWNNSVLRSATGEVVGTASIGEDVTEQRRTEEQLRQAQKMEAVGRLAGGVAHDFNNSLGVILGYTELLLRKAGEAERGKLEQIRKATERAAGLTRQLLAFSRKQVVDPKVLDLNALLSDLEKMLGRLIGEDIDLVIVAGDDLGQVRADPGQVEQVVMNLCVNARDAMPGGGRLRVETANAEVDATDRTGQEPMAAGRYVVLTVSDGGCGMGKEVLSRIFEPFFTTKQPGKGTGLGLAMVYGIVRQAGGYVWVDSEPGSGTSFRIYLPRIDESPAVDAREAPMPERGWETILLVEDDDSLRAIAREVLEEHGYRVLEARGPDEAIEIARRHAEPIHLLVTDVVMPGMNGRALAETLVAASPALRTLYMSGYTDDAIAHSGVLESGTLLLEKPFRTVTLLARVRAALSGRPVPDAAPAG